MLRGARLTMDADVDGDGDLETGVFDLEDSIRLGPAIRTGDLIGNQFGAQAGAIVDYFTEGEEGRAGFNLDIGGGAEIAEIEFNSFEGSTGRWGDGSSNAAADAEGEEVWRQISVFYQYFRTGTFDSENAATLEWGEFSASGVYEPFSVTFENPGMNFDAAEETSVFSNGITCISTRSIEQANTASNQQNGK